MIDAAGIFSALESHAGSLGYFSSINLHEPKSPPDVTGAPALMFESGLIEPASVSGLRSTSFRWEVIARIYRSDIQPNEVDSAMEVELVTATAALMTSFIGGFTLGGLIRNVDVRGETGEPMRGTPGWIKMDDTTYRTVDLLIPLLISDVAPEVP